MPCGRVLEKFRRAGHPPRRHGGPVTTMLDQFTTKAVATTGRTDADYTTRQGAYDLRKLRGKQLVAKPRPDPALPAARRSRPHHRRPAHHPRPGDRATPRRNPHPAAGAPTGHLDADLP